MPLGTPPDPLPRNALRWSVVLLVGSLPDLNPEPGRQRPNMVEPLASGYWLLITYWLLVAGDWLLVTGY